MNKRIDIPSELYEDEVVCFLADRYHTPRGKWCNVFLHRPDVPLTRK